MSISLQLDKLHVIAVGNSLIKVCTRPRKHNKSGEYGWLVLFSAGPHPYLPANVQRKLQVCFTRMHAATTTCIRVPHKQPHEQGSVGFMGIKRHVPTPLPAWALWRVRHSVLAELTRLQSHTSPSHQREVGVMDLQNTGHQAMTARPCIHCTFLGKGLQYACSLLHVGSLLLLPLWQSAGAVHTMVQSRQRCQIRMLATPG